MVAARNISHPYWHSFRRVGTWACCEAKPLEPSHTEDILFPCRVHMKLCTRAFVYIGFYMLFIYIERERDIQLFVYICVGMYIVARAASEVQSCSHCSTMQSVVSKACNVMCPDPLQALRSRLELTSKQQSGPKGGTKAKGDQQGLPGALGV